MNVQASDGPISLSHLLPELGHTILKDLDKDTLSASSLVSRSWMGIARPHLFRVIQYRRRPGVITNSLLHSVPPLQDLLDFLQATPSVRKHIRVLSLKIVFESPSDLEVAAREVKEGKGAQLDTLHSILRYTKHLQFLYVYRLRFAFYGSTPVHSSTARRPALKYLHHLRVDPRGNDTDNALLYQVLNLVGTVGTLSFNSPISISYMTPTSPQPPSFSIPLATTIKQIREVYVNHTQGISPPSMIDVAHMGSFHIRDLEPKHIPFLAMFLRNNDTSPEVLKHLALPIHGAIPWPMSDRDTGEPVFLPLLRLPTFKKLQSLTLSLYAWTPTPPAAHADNTLGVYASSYDFIVGALSTIADTLRSVTFRITYSEWPQAYDRGRTQRMCTDWSEVDDALAERAARRGLTAVCFILCKFEGEDIVRERVKQSMAHTDAMGVIRFVNATEVDSNVHARVSTLFISSDHRPYFDRWPKL